MEKVIPIKKDVQTENFDYNGVNITLNPFISAELEIALIKLYVEKYFTPNQEETLSYLKEGNFDYWLAEYSIKRAILEELTNIDVYETNSDTILDVFMSVSGGIENYDQFRNRLRGTVEAIKDSKSIGIVLDGLVTRVQDILQSFSNIDPEKLKETTDSVIQKMESSSVAPIFQEASQSVKLTSNKTKRKAKETKE